MAIQLNKNITIRGEQYSFTEIYDKDYAYFLTNGNVETLYCKQTDACYLRDKNKNSWAKIDQSAQINQLQAVKNQIGDLLTKKETVGDQCKIKISGRSLNAALKGDLTVRKIEGLKDTCYIEYYTLSKALSFASPELGGDEVIIDSNIKVNIQGTKIDSNQILVSIDESAVFPEINFN